MDSDALKIALDARSQLVGEANSLWNFYTVIALGVVGLIYGGVKLENLERVRVPVTIGYVIWAIANAAALVRNQSLLGTLTRSINHVASVGDPPALLKPFLGEVSAVSSWGVIVFHVVVDCVVVAAIWWPVLQEAPRTAPPPA